MAHDRIDVIDFGGQYAHLIATKVRKIGVLSQIRQPEDPVEAYQGSRGIIISGSPSLSSHGEDSAYDKHIFDLDIPILGFCFGHQEIAKHYGGEVTHGGREWGPAKLQVTRPHPLFAGLDAEEQVWMSHFDSVTGLGSNFEELGFTVDPAGVKHRFAAIGSDEHQRYGFQFHPEVDDTVHGQEMIANFVLNICGCRKTWSMERYLAEQSDKIREQVKDNSVFLLASGGVDSTVAARLFKEALGPDRLQLLHVDNGLMRKHESRQVLDMFRDMGLYKNLHFVDASRTFLEPLSRVIEPEKKRRIIGETFVKVFQAEATRLGIQDHLLGQGTIYPDTIETGGTRRADIIKTHHNRVPLIEEMIAQGKVIEPLAELYKTEVRELGERLKIPRELIWRHPFPGPGLGVRLLCCDGKEDREGFDQMGDLADIAGRFGLEALALPIRSVGVKADLRSYEHPVLFSGPAGWPALQQATSTVTADVPGINRCIWNLSDSVPERSRPLAATLTDERLGLLREADHLVDQAMRKHGIYDSIWQCPTVLVPLSLGDRPGELVVVRPVLSERAMTAKPAEFPKGVLDDLRSGILSLPGVSGLALDLTPKPPGTIEWE